MRNKVNNTLVSDLIKTLFQEQEEYGDEVQQRLSLSTNIV